jgi:hypothetical protein
MDCNHDNIKADGRTTWLFQHGSKLSMGTFPIGPMLVIPTLDFLNYRTYIQVWPQDKHQIPPMNALRSNVLGDSRKAVLEQRRREVGPTSLG